MSASLVDPKVELEFLASILQRRKPELHRVIPLLDESVFSNKPYRWMVKHIRTYFKSYQVPPPRSAVEVWIRESFEGEEEELKQHQRLLNLYDHVLTFGDHATKMFLDYASVRTYVEASREAVSAYQRSRDVGLLLRDGNEAVSAARSIQVQRSIYDYASGWRVREEHRKRRREYPDLYQSFRIGLEDIDAQVSFDPGTVNGFLAPFKRYKSVVLNHCSFAGLLQGMHVAQIVFENTIELTMDRLDSLFTQLTIDRLWRSLKTKDEKRTADSVMARVASWQQRLKIIKATPNETSTHDIEADLLALRQVEAFDPDLTVWDYANIMKPTKTSREERQQQTNIVWDLVEHAQNPVRPRLVITAFQAKLEGAKVERMDQSHFGKSIGIQQGLDSAIAINQTAEERGDGVIVFSPLFLRNGHITKPHCAVVSEIARMCIDKESDSLWKEVEDSSNAWVFGGAAA